MSIRQIWEEGKYLKYCWTGGGFTNLPTGSCILLPWIQCSLNPKVGLLGKWGRRKRQRESDKQTQRWERQGDPPRLLLVLTGDVGRTAPSAQRECRSHHFASLFSGTTSPKHSQLVAAKATRGQLKSKAPRREPFIADQRLEKQFPDGRMNTCCSFSSSCSPTIQPQSRCTHGKYTAGQRK